MGQGPRAYALRESLELALIVLGLSIADSLTAVPVWIWLAMPLGKVAMSISFYALFLRPHLRRLPHHAVETMIGQRGRALTRLDPHGQVRVNGEIWSARTANGGICPAGQAVTIRTIEGKTLCVDGDDAPVSSATRD